MTAAVDWDDIHQAGPHQVLTRAELHQLGVTPRMIATRIQPGGPWRRLLPGVIMLRNGTPSMAQLISAGLKYAGDGAVLTGIPAVALHGIARFSQQSNQIHVLIPAARKRISTGNVLVERTTRLPDIVDKQGFPTAGIARAVIDAARRMSSKDDVRALIAEAVQRGYTTPASLTEELEAGPMWGSALPRLALDAVSDGARSVAEINARDLARRSDLPPIQWNARLKTKTGTRLPTPDGWIDDVGLAWEIDSYEYHFRPRDYRRSLWRHNVMVAHGIVVVHTLPSRLISEPGEVIRELRAAYEQAAKRPRPDVIATW